MAGWLHPKFTDKLGVFNPNWNKDAPFTSYRYVTDCISQGTLT
jgi:hypothetical protein